MTPSDQQILDLLATYQHCRKFAHAGEVGANAVVLIAALEELLRRRDEARWEDMKIDSIDEDSTARACYRWNSELRSDMAREFRNIASIDTGDGNLNGTR